MSLLFAVCILAKDTEKLNCCTNYFRDNVKLIPEILVRDNVKLIPDILVRAKTLNLVMSPWIFFL
jgi:hypothetical protein